VAADFPDAMYSAVGARVGDRAAAFGADVVLKVRPPAATDARPGASPPGRPIGDEPRRSPPGGGGGGSAAWRFRADSREASRDDSLSLWFDSTHQHGAAPPHRELVGFGSPVGRVINLCPGVRCIVPPPTTGSLFGPPPLLVPRPWGTATRWTSSPRAPSSSASSSRSGPRRGRRRDCGGGGVVWVFFLLLIKNMSSIFSFQIKRPLKPQKKKPPKSTHE